ncbi:MAG: hypothetical protein PHI97_17100 [Desulfobulbus sp.]|nr:hypothetical protein [Desulfobulbus sp.]
MKLGIIIAALFLLTSCSHMGGDKSTDSHLGDHSLQQSPSETLLTCLQNNWEISRKEYKRAYKSAQEEFEARQSAYNTLHLVCLKVHPLARYSHFREGIKQLSAFREKHPADTSGLGGLEHLLQRLDRERMTRWNLSNKISDEKQDLTLENKELLERNQQLKQAADQDRQRLEELKKQIEQLKNIESIIKNRER